MKKVINNLYLPLLALIIIGAMYGYISINNLNNKYKELSQKQIDSELKLADLEKVNNDNKVILDDNQNRLADYQKQIDNLKRIAYAPKIILGDSTQADSQVTPTIINAAVAPKTITKTVVLKKEVVKKQVSVVIDGIGSYQVNWQAGDTAWSILKRASTKNNFVLQYQMYDFGVFVTGIGGIAPKGNQYWAFYYNGKYAQVGASDQSVSPGDTTFWQLATF